MCSERGHAGGLWTQRLVPSRNWGYIRNLRIRIRIKKSFIAKCVCTHKEFVLVLESSSTESTNRQQCKQRQHIIKVIKNTNNEENRQ